ncbi:MULTISPECIES: hypothetical protein [Pelosinus]|nr:MULTISPECIES: hypothetical protein [Pelosinus]
MAISKKNVITMKRSYSCSMSGVWNAVAHNSAGTCFLPLRFIGEEE